MLIIVKEIAEKCRKTISNLNAEVIEANTQLFGQYNQKLQNISSAKYPDVDRAYENLKLVHTQINKAIVTSQAKINKWDKIREKLETAWRDVNSEMKFLSESVKFNQKPQYSLIINQYEQVKQAYEEGNDSKINKLKNVFISQVESFKSEVIDEAVRKSVIISIIGILKEMGFQVAKPKLQTLRNGESQVSLKGSMSNGELVHFMIEQDGQTHFKLDNYEKTYCRDRIELIRTDLEKRLKTKVEIEQWEWHNPDLLRRGAKDLPNSGNYMYKSK